MPKDMNQNDVAVGDKISIGGVVESISETPDGRNVSIKLDDGDVISANSSQCVLTQLVPSQVTPAPPATNLSK